MSVLYGAWRPGSGEEALADCRLLARSFDGWKCDATGDAAQGPAAFGARVFRIYPESRDENQPVADKTRRVLMVADCRLDNREELANALGLDPRDERQTPDSGLIHGGYLRWGTGCFRRLEGDFAIAVWDGETRELLLARDSTGTRPLAYATWDGGAAFCSSVPELYRLPAVPRALDNIAIAGLLAGHATGRERTPFEAVRWVPPGGWVRISEIGIAKEIFSTIEPAALSREERREPAQRLGELLEQSVRKRLRGRANVACELSGGFDSGAVAALAARNLEGSGRSLTAISWTPDPAVHPLMAGPDERRQIQWMEQRYGFRCAHFAPYETGEAPGDALFRSTFRTRAAAALGDARVLLSGWGGDECATFYLRSFHPQAVFWGGPRAALTRLWNDLRATRLGYGAPLRLARGLKGTLRARRQAASFRATKSSIVDARLKPEWRAALAESHGEEILSLSAPRRAGDYMMDLVTRGHLEFRAAKECLDAARVGVEMAYPMQDARLLAFALSLNPGLFDYGSSRRQLFRGALASLSLELAPGTRKQEDALPIFHGRLRDRELPESGALTEIRAKFLKEEADEQFDIPRNRFALERVAGAVALHLEKQSTAPAVQVSSEAV